MHKDWKIIILIFLFACDRKELDNPNDPLNLPPPPLPLSPVNEVSSENPPLFIWEPLEDKEYTYLIEVSEDKEFSDVVLRRDTYYNFLSPYYDSYCYYFYFFRENTYYWRVSTINPNGSAHGEWSEIKSFKVKIPLLNIVERTYYKLDFKICKYEDYMYLFYYDTITIIKIKDKNAPQEIGYIPSEIILRDGEVYAGHLYVVGNTPGEYEAKDYLEIFSLLNPEYPIPILCESIPTSGYETPIDIEVGNNYCYILTNENIFIYSIQDVKTPVFLKKHETYDVNKIYLHFPYLFLIAYYSPLKILDVSSVESIKEIETEISVQDCYLMDENLIIKNAEGIYLLDINSLPLIKTKKIKKPSPFTIVEFLYGEDETLLVSTQDTVGKRIEIWKNIKSPIYAGGIYCPWDEVTLEEDVLYIFTTPDILVFKIK